MVLLRCISTLRSRMQSWPSRRVRHCGRAKSTALPPPPSPPGVGVEQAGQTATAREDGAQGRYVRAKGGPQSGHGAWRRPAPRRPRRPRCDVLEGFTEPRRSLNPACHHLRSTSKYVVALRACDDGAPRSDSEGTLRMGISPRTAGGTAHCLARKAMECTTRLDCQGGPVTYSNNDDDRVP